MKIIFVYNADSGFVSSLLDIGHKVISPDTYSCNLCKMTYGVIGEREEWKKYRESSKDEMEFLHKDEFENKYKEISYFEYWTIESHFTLIYNKTPIQFINSLTS